MKLASGYSDVSCHVTWHHVFAFSKKYQIFALLMDVTFSVIGEMKNGSCGSDIDDYCSLNQPLSQHYYLHTLQASVGLSESWLRCG